MFPCKLFYRLPGNYRHNMAIAANRIYLYNDHSSTILDQMIKKDFDLVRWRLFSTIVAFSIFTTAGAARALEDQVIKPLTIRDAIGEALERSPAFRQTEASANEAGWKKFEALSNALPRLSVAGNHLMDVKYQVIDTAINGVSVSFPALVPSTIASFTASWTLFDGLQTWNTYSAASAGAEAASLERDRARLAVENEVRLRFYQAIAAGLLADVATQNVKTLQDHLQKTKDRLREGAATKFDTLRTQVQLEEAIPEEEASRDNVVIARQMLATVMGAKKEDTRALSGKLPDPNEKIASSIPEPNQFDPKTRADIRALLKRAEAADKQHSAALGSWLPRIGFSAEQDVYNNRDSSLESGSFRNAHSVGVFMSWNLFDGGASIARQKEAFYQYQRAEAGAEAGLLRAPTELDLWRRRYAYNASLYQARLRAVDSARESVRLARLGYNEGTRTNTDVLDAELDLFRARAGVVRAQVDAAEALINAELALGHHLNAFNDGETQ